jgi:hypothetical protein
VSVLEEEARTLSEEAAIGRVRLEELERKVEALSAAVGGSGRTASTTATTPPGMQSQRPTD